MDHAELCAYTAQNPKEFAACETFNEFAAALDGSKPGVGRLLQHIAAKYPGQWDTNYRTIKRHGFTTRGLLLPDATKAADIFAHVALYPYESGIYRYQVPYVKAKAAFVHANRFNATSINDAFDYFGRLGASYVKNGKKHTSGGRQVITAAKPTQAVIDAYGDAGADDWDLSTFECVQWEDGRILVVARCHNGFGSHWLCILDAGETAIYLMAEDERSKIAKEICAREEAYAGLKGE